MMVKRKTDDYEEAFRELASQLKITINEDRKIWRHINHDMAIGRQSAYQSVIFEIEKSLQNNNLTMSDIGLAGYQIPSVD
jgi:ribosomal protein L18E